MIKINKYKYSDSLESPPDEGGSHGRSPFVSLDISFDDNVITLGSPK